MEKTPDIAFYDLLETLQDAGFSIQLNDYIEFTALFSRYLGDRESFKYYLAPIVCTSSEEQQSFYEIYDAYISRKTSADQLVIDVSGEGGEGGVVEMPPPGKWTRFWKKAVPILLSFYTWLVVFLVTGMAIRLAHLHKHPTELKTATTTSGSSTASSSNSGHAMVFVAKPYPTGKVDSATPKSGIYATGTVIEKENAVHSTIFAWLLMLGLTCLALSTRFFPKRKSKLLPPVDPALFGGTASPMELPMDPKPHLIKDEPELSSSAKGMSQSVETGVYQFSIPHTIRGAVRSFGFVDPVFLPEEKLPEFLVLIDRRSALRYGLFQTLVRLLIRERVRIHFYYFDNPYLYYSEFLPNPLDFAGLRERHSGSQLIVLSDGHAFIEPREGLAEKGLMHAFRHWDDRVLLTPIARGDWGGDEFLLSEHFRLLPADTEYIVRLSEQIQKGSRLSGLNVRQMIRHASSPVSPDHAGGLLDYLGDEDLMQWVCSMAVYPVIRWELLVSLGAAILGKRDALHKLNFDNLLKIVRISWLQGGSIPHSVRLWLLKRLTIEDELIARKTILGLLKETDGSVTREHFVYEEKMVQQYTQAFVLYASGMGENGGEEEDDGVSMSLWDKDMPTDTNIFVPYATDIVQNDDLEDDARMFMSLWDKGMLTDTATVQYLSNPSHDWVTPLKSFESSRKYAGAEEVMHELLSLKVIHNPFVRSLLRKAGSSLLVLLILLYLFKDTVEPWGINRAMGLVDRDYPASAIRVDLPLNGCLKKMLRGPWVELTLVNYDNNSYQQMVRTDGKDTISFEFPPVTMAGKESGKPVFRLMINRTVGVDCTDSVYHSVYTLILRGDDCDIQLPKVVPESQTLKTGPDRENL